MAKQEQVSGLLYHYEERLIKATLSRVTDRTWTTVHVKGGSRMRGNGPHAPSCRRFNPIRLALLRRKVHKGRSQNCTAGMAGLKAMGAWCGAAWFCLRKKKGYRSECQAKTTQCRGQLRYRREIGVDAMLALCNRHPSHPPTSPFTAQGAVAQAIPPLQSSTIGGDNAGLHVCKPPTNRSTGVMLSLCGTVHKS